MATADNGQTGDQGAGTQAGGTGSPASTSAAAASGASNVGAPNQGTNEPGSGTGTPGTGAAGAAGAAGATAGAKSYTYQEDRSNWVPPHRMREATSRYQQTQAELQVMRQQIAALTGVRVPDRDDQDPEAQAIRAQFEKLYPGLAKLNALADKLEKVAGLDPDELSAPNQHYWTVLGRRTLSGLVKEAEKAIGGELSPFAQKTLKGAFGIWIQDDEELQARYAEGDESLIADFLKEYQNGILDPYRRKSTVQAQTQQDRTRRLPRQGGAGVIAGAASANKPKPGDADYEDKTHDSAWARLNANG